MSMSMKIKLATSYDKMIDELNANRPRDFIYGGMSNDVAELNSLFGALLYPISCSLIFMVRNGHRHLLQANLRRL